MGSKDAPQFLGAIKKVASLVPWRQNAKWRNIRTDLTVTVGPFEEEETGAASNVVKVQGEDPATPGPLS